MNDSRGKRKRDETMGEKGANTKKAWDERIAHPTHGKC